MLILLSFLFPYERRHTENQYDSYSQAYDGGAVFSLAAFQGFGSKRPIETEQPLRQPGCFHFFRLDLYIFRLPYCVYRAGIGGARAAMRKSVSSILRLRPLYK
jgi:hypothetical protein